MDREEALRHIEKAQKIQEEMGKWLDETKPQIPEEDLSVLTLFLAKQSSLNPMLLLFGRDLTDIIHAGFLYGYKKGLEVGRLETLAK